MLKTITSKPLRQTKKQQSKEERENPNTVTKNKQSRKGVETPKYKYISKQTKEHRSCPTYTPTILLTPTQRTTWDQTATPEQANQNTKEKQDTEGLNTQNDTHTYQSNTKRGAYSHVTEHPDKRGCESNPPEREI